jgi:hypothetical protein
VHQELFDWANDDAPALTTMWLNGMAGIGKSAIASTFAQRMEDEGLLGATFFVDRQVADRRDPDRIVHSFAYDLAVRDNSRLRALWSSLCSDPTIISRPLEYQVEKLIREPLHGRCSQALVILIDGLDECTPSDGARLLSTLATCLSDFPIKLFISSRGEQHIVDVLRNVEHADVRLQDRHADEVSGDVRRYWEDSLDKLRVRGRPVAWRPLVTLDQLVELTGPLFIYATTVLRIIQNTRSSPIKKLSELLEKLRSGGASSVAFAGTFLDDLYTYILKEAVKDDNGESAEYAHQLRNILQVMIFARDPLTPRALSDLLRIDTDELHNYLVTLSSVLIVPDDADADGVIRPLHQSFFDFVLQRSEHVHSNLKMNSMSAAAHITELCLWQCNQLLHPDMCDIRDPSLFNDEVLNLIARLNKNISNALRYACRFWAVHWLEHIRAASSCCQVPLGLEEFCDKHLLHWIEVLSLTEVFDEVRGDLSTLLVTMEVSLFYLGTVILVALTLLMSEPRLLAHSRCETLTARCPSSNGKVPNSHHSECVAGVSQWSRHHAKVWAEKSRSRPEYW